MADGLLHSQFLLGPKRNVVIEVTRRMPGDLYSFPVELLAGLPHAYKVVKGWLPSFDLNCIGLEVVYPNFVLPNFSPSVCSRFQAYNEKASGLLEEEQKKLGRSVYSFTQNSGRLGGGCVDRDPKGVIFSWK